MNSKLLVRGVGLVLAIVMLFTMLTPAFASEHCENTPVISVCGFGHVPLVNGSGTQVFAPETSAIVSAVTKVVPALTKYLVDSDADALLNSVIPVFKTLFDPIKCDENGDSIDSTVKVSRFFQESADTYDYCIRENEQDQMSLAIADEIGGDHTFIYTYDWRRSPLEIAQELNAYIQNVKSMTGHSKVSIDGQSMGTCILQAYLALYGTDDVESIVMVSGAFTGLEMVGQLFRGNLQIDADGLYNIIAEAMEGSAEKDNTLTTILKYTSLFERVIEKLAPVIQEGQYKTRMYNEIFIPYFAMFPGMWAFVPSDQFDEALQYLFANPDFDYTPSLSYIAKITAYHNLVQLNMQDRCQNYFNSDDVNYYVVSNYNRQIAPVTPCYKWNADTVIETIHTSAYATVANRGETLGDGYIQAIDDGHDHLSRDNVVDASTCWTPEATWLIKNLEHVKFTQYGNGPLYAWLLTSKEQYTVWTNEEYPQFMYYNVDLDYLAPYVKDIGDVDRDGDVDLIDTRMALRDMCDVEALDSQGFYRADYMTIDAMISQSETQGILQMYSDEVLANL
ncbi:MAG: hypothetical protein K5761_02650 [Clostridiales bacterium]|nr:hypothetical protein [Clostridiales bacterium]